jgi:hypothetical protein
VDVKWSKNGNERITLMENSSGLTNYGLIDRLLGSVRFSLNKNSIYLSVNTGDENNFGYYYFTLDVFLQSYPNVAAARNNDVVVELKIQNLCSVYTTVENSTMQTFETFFDLTGVQELNKATSLSFVTPTTSNLTSFFEKCGSIS